MLLPAQNILCVTRKAASMLFNAQAQSGSYSKSDENKRSNGQRQV